MTAYKGFKFRLYPTEEQAEQINKTLDCCRYVYNHMLERRIKAYKRRKESFSYIGMQNLLPGMKKYLPWLAEADSQALKYACRCLDDAYKGFFKNGHGFPKFKSKRNHNQSYTTTNAKASMFQTKLSNCLVWDGCRTAKAVISKARFVMPPFAVLPAESILCLSSARWRLNQSPVSIQ